MQGRRIHLILVALLCLAAGCSSLPKGPPPATELNSRTSVLHKLGLQHYQAGRYVKAEAYFDRALGIHAAVDDRAGVALCYLSKGRVALARGNARQADLLFEQAVRSLADLSRPDLMAQALGGRAVVQETAGGLAEAEALLRQALALPLESASRERAVLHHDLGSVLMQTGDYPAARVELEAALSLHEAQNDRQGIATACYTLSLWHEAAGDFSTALASARRALDNDKAILHARGVAKDLELLANLHRKLGDDEAAADYHRRATLAREGTLP